MPEELKYIIMMIAVCAFGVFINTKDPVVEDSVIEIDLANRVYFFQRYDYVVYYQPEDADVGRHYVGNCNEKWFGYKLGFQLHNQTTTSHIGALCSDRKEAKEILQNQQLYIDFPDLPREFKIRPEE